MENSARAIVQEGSLSSRLVTQPLLDSAPPALQVCWIHWDSPFQQSGLVIGDQIIAVNGLAVIKPEKDEELRSTLPMLVGQYAENQAWEKHGSKESDPLVLTVRRRNLPGEGWKTFELKGALCFERKYLNDQERWILGPGGPDLYASDGFSEPWAAWYERFVTNVGRTLQMAWQPWSFASRYELGQHMDYEPRVNYLTEHYPGPVAQTVNAIWETTKQSLSGRVYEISPSELEYRRAEEDRVRQVADLGRQAWDQFLQANSQAMVEPFPGVDPIEGDFASRLGKYVVLPAIGYRDWINEGGHYWFASGQGATYYFADTEALAADRMLQATRRYRKVVGPNIRDEYRLIARVLPEPRLMVVNGQGIFGTQVEPVAALAGEAMFVDLTVVADGISPFCGEENLMKPRALLPPDDNTPKQVMEAFVAALKEGDLTLWKQLFADWYITELADGRPILHGDQAYISDNEWEDSRRRILSDVYGIEVVWTGDSRDILSGHEFERAPHIEEVVVEIDHIGSFDGEYRAFANSSFQRFWKLQRIDGGPWRISSVHGI